MNVEEQLLDLVHRLNRAWREERFEDLASFFHERAVFVAPGFSSRIVGREACVESYRTFATQARIHGFDLEEIETDVAAGTAVTSYRYVIDYEIEGRRWRGSGHDLFVLVRDAGSWLVVWRTMIPGDEEEISREGVS